MILEHCLHGKPGLQWWGRRVVAKIVLGAEVENWILVDRLVRDWVIVAEEKDSSGAEAGNWLLVDRLMRDWVTVVEEKDCCQYSSGGRG